MKRRLITLERIIATGTLGFVRNLSLAAAAMAVMVVTLTIILFSIVANATFSNTIAQITAKIDISVYLNDSVSLTRAHNLEVQLRRLPNVKKVNYVSKDEALAEYEAENAGNTQLLQAITETSNPLPASIQITPINTSEIQGIKNFLDRPGNIGLQDPQAGTSYSGDQKLAIDKIAHATNILRELGLIAVVVFALISVLIIFNTIRMAIFNRRDEINIERLLGANTWFIRGPFVVESVLYGVIAAAASLAIIYALFIGSASELQASSLGLLDIGYANAFLRSHVWGLLLLQMVLGILIGAASSVIATRRYLKLKTTK